MKYPIDKSDALEAFKISGLNSKLLEHINIMENKCGERKIE
jgi:hypothetical protein